MAAPTARLGLVAPVAVLVTDTTTAAGRRLDYTILAGPGASSITMRVAGAEVLAAALDGRPVDRSRYRYQTPGWGITYWAPPDSGFRLELTVPAEGIPEIELVTLYAGLPGVALPERPANVLPSQTGDVRLAYRRVSLAAVPLVSPARQSRAPAPAPPR
jgi:hypothetical protein